MNRNKKMITITHQTEIVLCESSFVQYCPSEVLASPYVAHNCSSFRPRCPMHCSIRDRWSSSSSLYPDRSNIRFSAMEHRRNNCKCKQIHYIIGEVGECPFRMGTKSPPLFTKICEFGKFVNLLRVCYILFTAKKMGEIYLGTLYILMCRAHNRKVKINSSQWDNLIN